MTTHKKKWNSENGSKCTLRKARNYHECEECGATIEPKEDYLEVTYMGDDYEYHTIRICKNCMYRY